jgi:uncharacterized protein HemY
MCLDLEQNTKAATKIDELTVTNPNDNWVLSLAATLAIYKSDFRKASRIMRTS